MASYRVVTGIITFPDREPLQFGQEVEGGDIALYLPRLTRLKALERIMEAVEPDPLELGEEDSEESEGDQGNTVEDAGLEDLNVKALRPIAKALGISPYPDSKADMIAAIVAARAAKNAPVAD